MQLKTVKTLADLPFKGVELVKVDNAIVEVIIGGKLRIRKGDSYSTTLQVCVVSAGETVQRHRVTAVLEGFPDAVEFCEDSYEAQKRQGHFENLGAKVEVEKVDVVIGENGEPVPDARADEVKCALFDEIPF